MPALNSVALVTGGGSGIGRASAVALARAGYRVVVCGRREDALQGTVQLALDDPAIQHEVLALPADITDPDSVADLFAKIDTRYGRLDLLFNNAGANTTAVLPGELAWDDWRAVMSVNVDGLFLCSRHAFRLMQSQRPQGGRIINNGSVSAYAPRPFSLAYTASKHAVTGVTKSIALDGRPFDIACCQIDIGNATTDMTARMSAGVPQADGRLAAEPTIDVQLVARTIVHMASLPLDANIPFLTIKATKMPLYGRG